MLINLSDVLSEHHKTIDMVVPVELTEFKSSFGRFQILDKKDAHIVIKHVKQRELSIIGEADLVLEIPCDRCLEPVKVPFSLQFMKNVNLQESEDASDDEMDE